MDLHAIPRLNRLKTIILTLIKYGFDDIIARLDLPEKMMKAVSASPQKAYSTESTWRRLRYVLEDLGPTFVKLGQVLSLRADLIPVELADELKGLQKEVPAEDFETVKKLIEEELDTPLDEMFSEFEQQPIAAASLAQVHRARLKPGIHQERPRSDQKDSRSDQQDEAPVAVKVQRPDIYTTVQYDLELLGLLAEEIHKHAEDMQVYNLPALVRELSEMMQKELDFTCEARNMQAARKNSRHETNVYLPAAYPDISTPQVLIMELIEGRTLEDLESLSSSQRLKLAQTGIRTALTQILEDGLFHADPHPGNILVLPNGKLSLLDWGMVGRLTPDMRLKLLALMLGLIDKDSEVVLDVLLAISDVRIGSKRDKVHRDILRVLDDYFSMPVADTSIGGLLYQVTEVFRSHGIPIQPDLAAMVRALLTSESSARLMYAEIDVIGEAQPYIQQVLLRLYSPHTLLRRFRSKILRTLHTRRRGFDVLYSVLDKLERDQLTIRFEHHGLEHIEYTLSRVANRLALSLLTAAIIIGSSMILTTGVEPLLFGFPLIGIIGYLISAVFGAWIILHIIRKHDI